MKKKTYVRFLLAAAASSLLVLSACGAKEAESAGTETRERVKERVKEGTKESEETQEETQETVKETTEEDAKQEQLARIQSVLGDMPYYGDTSKCQMSMRQATAYAQLIADGLAGDFGFRGGYNERVDIVSWSQPFQVFDYDIGGPVEVNRFNVMLADFAGDGVPYLYLYCTTDDPTENHAYVLKSFEIYGWKDDKAKLIYDSDKEKMARVSFRFYEDEEDAGRFKLGHTGGGSSYETYAFSGGDIQLTASRTETLMDDGWHVVENGVEEIVPFDPGPYVPKTHEHTLPFTCFHDMSPCTLEDMVNYLNAYAAAISGGEARPVEVRKLEYVPETTAAAAAPAETEAETEASSYVGSGEVAADASVPQWKINSLKILKQYIDGDKTLGVDYGSYAYKGVSNADYLVDPENFRFGLTDLNNDGNQELLVMYSTWYADVYLPTSSTDTLIHSICGSWDGMYLKQFGSSYAQAALFTYDGSSFSKISELNEDCYQYISVDTGETETLSSEEFYAMYDDWGSSFDVFEMPNHLDISNIESVLRVRIEEQSSGGWLVTNAG